MVTIVIISLGSTTFCMTLGSEPQSSLSSGGPVLVLTCRTESHETVNLKGLWHDGHRDALLLILPSCLLLHPFPETYLWDFGIRMGPSSQYQPSSSFLNVNTRPPTWSLASRMVTWCSERLLSFPGSCSHFSHPLLPPPLATGSTLEFPAVGPWMCRITKLGRGGFLPEGPE